MLFYLHFENLVVDGNDIDTLPSHFSIIMPLIITTDIISFSRFNCSTFSSFSYDCFQAFRFCLEYPTCRLIISMPKQLRYYGNMVCCIVLLVVLLLFLGGSLKTTSHIYRKTIHYACFYWAFLHVVCIRNSQHRSFRIKQSCGHMPRGKKLCVGFSLKSGIFV